MNKCSAILDLCVFLPERVVTSREIAMDFSGWLPEMANGEAGILERRLAAPHETASDLAEKAALELFSRHDRSSVDFIINCIQYPDYYKPTTACLLQKRLGLRSDIGAYDINLEGSGFVYGLALAKGLIAGGIAASVLLLTSSCTSRYVHPKDLAGRYLFGDGAAAALVTSSERNSIFSFVYGSDRDSRAIFIPNGAFRQRYDFEAREFEYQPGSVATHNQLLVDRDSFAAFAMEKVPAMVNAVLQKNDCGIGEVDHAVFHQADPVLLDNLASLCSIPGEKFFNGISRTGNTGPSSIPIGIRTLMDEGRLRKGQRVLLAGYGAGGSLAATIIEI